MLNNLVIENSIKSEVNFLKKLTWDNFELKT
jgi:hypothetical protein